MRTPRLRLLASAVLAGTLLAGCGTGPASVGAAAFVGQDRIPVNEVQSRLRTVLDKEPGAREKLEQQDQVDELGRRLASDLVRRRLINQAAAEERLHVDQRQVGDVINAAGGAEKASKGQIYTAGDLPEAVRARLLTGELGRKYIDRVSVVYDVTTANNRREAEQKARAMSAGPQQSRDLVGADHKAGLGAATSQRVRSAEVPDLAASTPVFAAQPGTVLAFELQPQSGQWTVLRVNAREVDPSAPATGAGQDEARMQAFGSQLLRVTAQRNGVQLSPRYGVWDPIGLAAVQSPGETTGFAFSTPAA